MILVTTGTNGAPFDRLLRELGRIEDEQLVVQLGPSTVRLPRATCFDYVSFSKLVELVRDARVVVTHAGVGSVLVALANHKRPLVVPRLARFGEAVDDHQLELARRLDAAELATMVEDTTRIPEFVRLASPGGVATAKRSSTPLLDDLRDYLSSTVGQKTPE